MHTSSMFRRTLSTITFSSIGLLAMAQDAAPTAQEHLFNVDSTLLYAMVALAVVQVVFIISIAGIMRTMGGSGGWVKRLVERSGRATGVVTLLLVASGANAQAYQPQTDTMSLWSAFWWLFAINVFLFIILLVQMNILRSLTRAVVGVAEEGSAKPAPGPTWADRILKRLTRQVSIEEEKNIDLHHDYDGIRELDNVLPPWWLWLFYGTIAWGVIYLVNMHVINVWQHQDSEYINEMAQAKSDVEAYMATLTNTVDENSVTFTDDAALLAGGRELFNTYCTACHGADASGSETSVGPNLTDAYWIHGGGVKNIFKTIKYGVPEKGMIAWKAQLQPAELRSLACYIMSLEGKGSATQKAPQGELWKEEPAASDGTATPVDSLVPLTGDTARVAMK
ncbi:MAG TPA: cbb3-type cytochrome c oxidase N-terminal domain-containing protein [Flavobacteriales bacterium]|nr:cbb3-type cytochrome c oxidase N-terminal domain-containing protein [Flavobacteriales bacterium]